MQVEVDGLTKRFGRLAALDHVSLSIDPGQIVAVLGANGAGKSTLLRCLAGVYVPDQGRILYDRMIFRRDRIDLRKGFYYLADVPFHFPYKTIIEHLGIVTRLYDKERAGVEETVIELLRKFDLLPLAENAMANLSRGQTYKSALVGLFAVDPEVWLIDEPFASGMDPRGISIFRNRARDATQSGHTVVYTTQILTAEEGFADRVCILHHGRVHFFGSLEALHHDAASHSGSFLEEVFLEFRGDSM